MSSNDLNVDELDPGIRDLVVYLRARGWNTIDSGDGSKAGTMECALPYRHVAARPRFGLMVPDAHQFLAALRDAEPDTEWHVDATYSPNDGESIVFGYEKDPDEQ
jgi:hypothetical protein